MPEKPLGAHRGARVSFLLVLLVTTPLDSAARQGGSGRAQIVRWPQHLYETAGAMDVPFVAAAERYADAALLAAVDTLSLDYAWETSGGMPLIRFDLSWVRGEGGVVEGLPASRVGMPDSVTLWLLDLHAEVRVDGRRAGDLVLSLDSLALPPAPFLYGFETETASWDGVFAGMDSAATRSAFERGFELAALDILRISFQGFDVDDAGRGVRVVRRVPRRRAIFVPDPEIWIGWDLGPDPYRPPPRAVRGTSRKRPSGTGRTGTSAGTRDGAPTRGGTRAEGPKNPSGSVPVPRKDDDDEDDRSDLLGPALAGAAAVGALAVLGGSAGLSAWSDAPIGLAAGRMTARYGFIVHTSVTGDVFSGGPDEVLRVGFTAYGRPSIGPLMPGAGLGVRVRDTSGSARSALAVEAGAALQLSRVFVVAGVDLLSGAGHAGLVFAFRDPGRRR